LASKTWGIPQSSLQRNGAKPYKEIVGNVIHGLDSFKEKEKVWKVTIDGSQ